MEEKFNESTSLRPEGNRLMDGPLVTIDLYAFIEQIRKEKTWEDRDRNAITVFKTAGMRIVLIALHQGAVMNKHEADGTISIQVIDGHLRFNTNENSITMKNGQMLALHKGIPHSVEAIEETIFLLTITTSTEEK